MNELLEKLKQLNNTVIETTKKIQMLGDVMNQFKKK